MPVANIAVYSPSTRTAGTPRNNVSDSLMPTAQTGRSIVSSRRSSDRYAENLAGVNAAPVFYKRYVIYSRFFILNSNVDRYGGCRRFRIIEGAPEWNRRPGTLWSPPPCPIRFVLRSHAPWCVTAGMKTDSIGTTVTWHTINYPRPWGGGGIRSPLQPWRFKIQISLRIIGAPDSKSARL